MFLQGLVLDGTDAAAAGGLMAGFAALILGMLFVIVIVAILAYIYSALAFMAIAKKANYPTPAIAWIPYVGPLIILSSVAKMHWWPILLLIGYFIPVANVFLAPICSVVLLVFTIIWFWKTCEAINYPGWYALLMLIPIVNLVMLGVIAWSKK